MRKLTAVGSLAVLASLALLSFAPPRHNPGPGAIVDLLKGLFTALDKGDRDAAQACLVTGSSFPVLVYDLDLNDAPVTLGGTDAARKYLDAIVDFVKKGETKLESKITDIHADCNSPDLGYATLEFSQTFTTGGKSETRAYRATALVTWEGKNHEKGPKLFHWHASAAPKTVAKAEKQAPDKSK